MVRNWSICESSRPSPSSHIQRLVRAPLLGAPRRQETYGWQYAHCFVRSDGWFEHGDSVFISMEYFQFGDLQRNLARPLPELEARQITMQVLEGLEFMHDNDFVHRDLKPGVWLPPPLLKPRRAELTHFRISL